jgi:hypothetical protein
MNYELAIKLEQAGFPNIRPCKIHNGDHTNECDECASYPTLSELIEACGDKLIALQRQDLVPVADKSFKWCAVKKYIDYEEPAVCEGGYGQTPKEAVAKLWLELNSYNRQ